MTTIEAFKKLGETKLAWFSQAKISEAEALKLVKVEYPKSNSRVQYFLAGDLHQAAKMAEREGYVLPWIEDVGTLFVLTIENNRAVYIPAIFTDDILVNRLNKESDGDGYARVSHAAIKRANAEEIDRRLRSI